MFDSFEEKQELIQLIHQILSEFSIFNHSHLIDKDFFFEIFSLYLNFPLITAFPVLKFFILFYGRVDLLFGWVFVDLDEFISIFNEIFKGFESVGSLVAIADFVVEFNIFFDIILPN